jgi:drug/metabolite transporter (DMT)-like permease
MTPSDRPRLLAYLALLVGIVSIAFSAIFFRWADAPGPVTSFYRTAIATVLMAVPFYRRARRSPGGLPRRGVRFAILGGLFFAGDLGFWSTGIRLSGAVNPTLLANTAPLWVGLGALVLFRERLGPPFWFGLVLSMGGAVVIMGLDALRAASLGLGSFFGLLSGLFYGGYFLATQQGRETLHPLSYFWPAAFSSALVLLLTALALGHPFTGYSTHTYLIFVLTGVVNQVIGWLAVNYAQGYLPASMVAPTMLGQPVLTALLAWLLLGEALTWGQGLGGAAVLAGVFIVHWSRQNYIVAEEPA